MKLSKLPSACPEEHFVTLIFFQKFSTVLNFLQKPLAWFSKIYLSVQSKNCGRNSFFLFFLPEFFRLLSKIFLRLSAKKLQKFVKTTFYVSRGTICDFTFFLSFESFWIFCRHLRHGSQNSIYVSRVKIAEETVFLFFFSDFFSDFERKIFQTSSQKTSKSFQNYLLRVRRNSLWLEILQHGSQNSIYVSRVKISE